MKGKVKLALNIQLLFGNVGLKFDNGGNPHSPGLSRRRSLGQWACFWQMKEKTKRLDSAVLNVILKAKNSNYFKYFKC